MGGNFYASEFECNTQVWKRIYLNLKRITMMGICIVEVLKEAAYESVFHVMNKMLMIMPIRVMNMKIFLEIIKYT